MACRSDGHDSLHGRWPFRLAVDEEVPLERADRKLVLDLPVSHLGGDGLVGLSRGTLRRSCF
jgi:hypothetical protein